MRNVVRAFAPFVLFGLLAGCAAEQETTDVAPATETGTEAQGLNVVPMNATPTPALKLLPFPLSVWGALPAGYTAPTVLDTVVAGSCLYRAGYIVSIDPNLLGEHKVFVQRAQDPRNPTACTGTGYIVVGKSYDPPQIDITSRPTGTTAASTQFIVGYTRKTTPLCDPTLDYALVTFGSSGVVRRNAKVMAIGTESEILSGVVNVVSPSGTVTVHGTKNGPIAGEVVPAYGTYVDGSHYMAAFNGNIFDVADGVLLPASVEAY